MTVSSFNIQKLDRVDVVLPEEDLFERLFGYTGDKRFVSLFIIDDDLMYDDGQKYGTGRMHTFATWWNHSLVADIRSKYDIKADYPPEMAFLLLDRKQPRKLYAGANHLAYQIVREDDPSAAAHGQFTITQWETYRRLLCNGEFNSPDIDEEGRKLSKLKNWLDEEAFKEKQKASGKSLAKANGNFIPFAIMRLTRIETESPPPHLFEELMEVESEARFLSFWHDGSNIHYSDGVNKDIGYNRGWKIWRYMMYPLLRYNFEIIDGFPPSHHLVLDRLSRRIYAVKADRSDITLASQYGISPPEIKEPDDFYMGFEPPKLAPAEVEKRMEELKRWVHCRALKDDPGEGEEDYV